MGAAPQARRRGRWHLPRASLRRGEHGRALARGGLRFARRALRARPGARHALAHEVVHRGPAAVLANPRAITRVAFIYSPDNPNTAFYKRSFEAASGPLAVEPIDLPIHGLADIERAVASFADRQNTGASFPSDLTTVALRNEIVSLMARHHLPAIYSDPAFVRAGGLA